MNRNNIQQILTALDEACIVLSDIPNINKGGCGIAAVSLYRYLEKYHQYILNEYPVKFCIINDDLSDTIDNANWIKAYNNNELNINEVKIPDHIALVIDKYIIDCNGLYDSLNETNMNSAELYDSDGYVLFDSAEYLLTLINQVQNWNSSFRRRHVKNIAMVLNIDLSDIYISYHY